MTKDEYLDLLKRATQALEEGLRDGSAFTEGWESPVKLGDELAFWQDDDLFDDPKESIVIDGETVELVSIPTDYIAMGSDSLEDALEIAEYELDYIEKRLLIEERGPCVAWDEEERDVWKSLKALIKKIKQFIKDYAKVNLPTEAKTLAEFEENWKKALGELIEMFAETIKKVLKMSTSIIPLADWDKAGVWIVAAGDRLPRVIKEHAVGLQMFIRFLMGHLRRMWNGFKKLLGHLAHLLDLFGDEEEDEAGKYVKRFIEWVIELIKKPVANFVAEEIWHTDRLEKDFHKWVNEAAQKVGGTDAALSQAQQKHLIACLTEIQETLTKINVQIIIIGYAAQGVGMLMGVSTITAAGLPAVALGLGSIIVTGIIVLVAMGADALRDEPYKGCYVGIAPLAEKKLKKLANQ